MPSERQSLTHKFSIAGHEGYITAGEYEDGTLGEIFLTDIGKEGSTIKGMMNAFATAISLGLQYGVPLETFVRKFAYVRFEPEGITRNPEIPFAKSMPDYIMRWVASRYGDADLHEELGILTPGDPRTEGGRDGRAERGHGRPGGEPANGGERPHERRQRRLDAERVGEHPEAGSRGADRRAAEHPGEAAGPGAGPGLRDVRRHDAAHRLVLHVLELRQQHRLRLSSVEPARQVQG